MSDINIEELRNQLQERLNAIQIDEIQTTINMDDVQVGITDTRNPIEQRRTYSNDLEGELLQRFDETKDYETRMKLAEQIKQERERKSMEKVMEAQRKQQEIKDEFVSELKDKQAELSKKITELQQKIIAAEAARVKIEDQMEEQQKIVIKGVKSVGEKVYKAAQDEINRNSRSVRSRMARIRKLESQRAEAQADFDNLDAYIKEISLEERGDQQQEIVLGESGDQQQEIVLGESGDQQQKIILGEREDQQQEVAVEEDLVSAQEDEMWAEYRRQAAIRKKLEEEGSWIVHNVLESIDEEIVAERTEKEKRAYYDEQDKIEQDEIEQGKAEKDKVGQDETEQGKVEKDKTELDDETFKKIQAIFDRKQQKTSTQVVTVKPTQPVTSKEHTTSSQSKTTTKTQNNNSIEGVRFYIVNGQPIYEVAISTEGKNIEYAQLFGWNKIKETKPSESQRLLKEIDNPDKYYDQNIASILEIVDKKYGTNGLAQYVELLKTKPIKDGSKVDLNIAYYFDNSDKISKENKGIKRYIKRLAKSNSKLGRVSYEKSPNIFRRLWNKIKTLKLDSGEMERNIPIRNDEYTQMKMMEGLNSNPTHDNVIEALRSGVQDQNFSISEFAKAYKISEEEVRTYMENPKIMGINRSEAFRLSQRIDRQLLDHQESGEDSGEYVEEVEAELVTDRRGDR